MNHRVGKMGSWLIAGALSLAIAGCGSPDAKQSNDKAAKTEKPEQAELVVSAAASLTDSLQKLQQTYESKHPNVKLRFNFGASGTLQQQIEQGAPADLFVSAAAKNMKPLVDKGLIDAAKQTTLLRNELVLVVPKSAAAPAKEIADLAKANVTHVAVGEPESVPAGGYAKEALTNAKLWDAVQTKLIYGKDVRQVLTYVETGNADAGFVYKTDALTSKQSVIGQTVDPALYKPIEIQIGIVKSTKRGKEAQELLDYLQSKEAMDVFVSFGFTPAGS